MSKLLLLEDDVSLIQGLSFALLKSGFELFTAHTLCEADSLWEKGIYDLLILDVSLPDGSGFRFCEKVRKTSQVPILFLTASDEEISVIMGLDMGGDDYMTKPFKLAVFMSRINALLRRSRYFRQDLGELYSNVILSAEQIMGKLWDCDGNFVDGNTLAVYIRRLRAKIEDDPARPSRILTVRRMGYKWNTGGAAE